MKLQQAFISETGEYYGNFKIIGYSAPGQDSKTTNFEYTNPGSYQENTLALPSSAEDAWVASSRIKLNDCALGGEWKVQVEKANQGSAADAVKFTAVIDGDNCEELTPSFTKIGK